MSPLDEARAFTARCRLRSILDALDAARQTTHDLGHEYSSCHDGSVVVDPAGGLRPRWTAADLAAIPLAEPVPCDAEPVSDRTIAHMPRRGTPTTPFRADGGKK
jgi:hypothetical protein